MRLPARLASLAVLAATALLATAAALAQDVAAIRKNIAERLPNFPKIDEISKTPMSGLYEVRAGVDVYYTDEKGNFLIDGHLIDTASRSNLTQARIDKLTAIDPATLNPKDAIVWKQGTGARKLVVFADPNCGYCKRFERDLNDVKDVTVYTYVYPILGGDSPEKAKNIWCAKDRTAVWRDWMLNGTTPPRAMGQCDTSALERNAELGQKYKINGTPALIFEDGKRVGGAMNAASLEKQLVASRTKP